MIAGGRVPRWWRGLAGILFGEASSALAEPEELASALNFEMVKLKLMDRVEGLGWSQEQADHAADEYRRFLILCAKYPDRAIVPTQMMDAFWHAHILDTRAYAADCKTMFGSFFHHFPYFGMRSDVDAANRDAAFDQTRDLYAAEFGEPLVP